MPQPKLLAKRHFSSNACELHAMRELVQQIAESEGGSSQFCKEAVLGVNEACMNIIQHAYCGNDDGEIVLEILRDKNFLIFRLTDFAPPVDNHKCKSRDLDDIRPGGLGIHIISSVMNEMKFIERPTGVGNILEMKKNIAEPN